MKRTHLYIAWAFLYGICTALGFLSDPTGWVRGLCIVMSVAFFVPPAILLGLALTRKEAQDMILLRRLSIASLSLTLAVLILNFLSANTAELWGNMMHGLLVIVSTPMVCSRFWLISLFLWACILMVCLQHGPKKPKKKKK